MVRTTLREKRDTDKERLLDSINRPGKQITVIVGLSKNAGKTTLLNWLLEHTAFSRKGVITTGRDGEDIDVLEKIDKPQVRVPASSLFTVRASEIHRKSPYLQILEKLPYKAGGENIWLVKTENALNVEIVGPPSVAEQIETAGRILSYGAEHIFVDGSLDRKAIGSSPDVNSLIICGSPAYGDLPSLKREFRKLEDLTLIRELREKYSTSLTEELLKDDNINLALCSGAELDKVELVSLPYETLLGHEKNVSNYVAKRGKEATFLYIPTSVTERVFHAGLKGLLQEFGDLELVIKHPFHLQLEEQTLNWLRSSDRLLALKKLDIAGFTINSYAIDGKHIDCEFFRKSIREEFMIPVVDVMEIGSQT